MKKEQREPTNTEVPQVNPGYALFQIARALLTGEQHDDPATRERAQRKISQWQTVFTRILDRSLNVGSRQPLADVPTWATLEVLKGGFASGTLLAAGPLLEHEQTFLTSISSDPSDTARHTLNTYYLTDEGLQHLQEYLLSGCYEVQIPEEGALLVVAWLLRRQFADEARDLLQELAPFFSRLRFYPIPVKQSRLPGSRVYVQDVKSTVDLLRMIQPNRRILAQKEAIQIWNPLYDQIVSLFLETVEGDPPHLNALSDERSKSEEDLSVPIAGGWPCQHYSDSWRGRARQTLDAYTQRRDLHTLCGKPECPKENFAQLRTFLRRCVDDPQTLSGRDVGRIRQILAGYVTKRGVPMSPQCQTLRKKQAEQTRAPAFSEIAKILVHRLDSYPHDRGVDDLEPLMHAVTEQEAVQGNVEEGTGIPASLQRKLARCLYDTIDVLVERRVITSGETLARVIPQITSEIRAAGISDPALSHLYAAIYRAFRRRRSLLLLNLESQVRLEELPWVAAIERFRQKSLSTGELTRQTLEEVVALTITSFPYTIIPNKLLQELRALSKGAELSLPLVDELAADIFMGEFSPKFLAAAKEAAELLGGTIYATYFGIDYADIRRISVKKRISGSWSQRITADRFGQLCASRAGVSVRWGNPATNGMIIEQQQILTSQNLAVLFKHLHLADVLHETLFELAQRSFTWICQRQQVKTDNWHARLITVKNTAYAWRQMVFYLAVLPKGQAPKFISWADDHLKAQNETFQRRFAPALRGLQVAAEGRTLDNKEVIKEGARRFLGWTTQKHWLLE